MEAQHIAKIVRWAKSWLKVDKRRGRPKSKYTVETLAEVVVQLNDTLETVVAHNGFWGSDILAKPSSTYPSLLSPMDLQMAVQVENAVAAWNRGESSLRPISREDLCRCIMGMAKEIDRLHQVLVEARRAPPSCIPEGYFKMEALVSALGKLDPELPQRIAKLYEEYKKREDAALEVLLDVLRRPNTYPKEDKGGIR